MVHLDNSGFDVIQEIENRYLGGDVIPFVLDLDSNYLVHPYIPSGTAYGWDVPDKDGTGIWNGQTWLYRVGNIVFGASP